MPRIVRSALLQATLCEPTTSPIEKIKQAMIGKHVAMLDSAASQGAQVACLQELFYGPYFCAEQETKWYDLTERIPDGPTTNLCSRSLSSIVWYSSFRFTKKTYRESTTTRRPSSTRMASTSASFARSISRIASQASGRNSIFVPEISATRSSIRRLEKSAFTSATIDTSQTVPDVLGSTVQRSSSTPRQPSLG